MTALPASVTAYRERQHRRTAALIASGHDTVDGVNEAAESHHGEERRNERRDGDDDGRPWAHHSHLQAYVSLHDTYARIKVGHTEAHFLF